VSEEDIIALAIKHHLELGMFPPSRLTKVNETTLKFVRPPDMTFYGQSLMAFARELIEITAAGRTPADLCKGPEE